MKATRVEASIIADDINVERFEPGYDEQGQKRSMPAPSPVNIKPGGFQMPLVDLTAPSVGVAPKPGLGKNGNSKESVPGTNKRS